MALALAFSAIQPAERPVRRLTLTSLSSFPQHGIVTSYKGPLRPKRNCKGGQSLSVSCSATKLVRDRPLDKHVEKQNRIRFVQKLITLLLSKPKHFMPLQILSKCRSYLALPKPRSILSMIHRYPTIFEVFTVPYPPKPLNATKTYPQLCVRLTPAVEALVVHENNLKTRASLTLATKLQKLLMLSSHRRLLLSKLVHLGPDLGLPVNFQSRLCTEYPEKFKIVDTSYGRALELVTWESQLANPMPRNGFQKRDLIVDRPLKFKLLKLRKGLNLKRSHHDFLLKFEELPDICPYKTQAGEFPKASIEEEKRGCGVIREVLGMMLEKKTLVDHLSHFRKDFGLPNQLRGLMMRHPELFYVSLKGLRNSIFLVEAYDDDGMLIEKDESLVIKDRLFDLINVGKNIRREWRKCGGRNAISLEHYANSMAYEGGEAYEDESEDDDGDNGSENLFDWDDPDFENYDEDDNGEFLDPLLIRQRKNFWTTASASKIVLEHNKHSEPW